MCRRVNARKPKQKRNGECKRRWVFFCWVNFGDQNLISQYLTHKFALLFSFGFLLLDLLDFWSDKTLWFHGFGCECGQCKDLNFWFTKARHIELRAQKGGDYSCSRQKCFDDAVYKPRVILVICQAKTTMLTSAGCEIKAGDIMW